MCATPVTRVSEYVEEVARIRDQFALQGEGIWFRGLKDSTFDLQPSFYRQTAAEEHFVVVDYMSLADPLLSDADRPRDESIKSQWQWYFLMQHYGAPTRLLDWTELPLAALYFAVRELRDPSARETLQGPPCVWLLDPGALNTFSIGEDNIVVPSGRFSREWLYRTSPEDRGGVKRRVARDFEYEGKPYSNRRPLAIYPVRQNRRILAQQGVFTVHGADDRALNVLFDWRDPVHRLERIEVDPSATEALLDQLQWLGVHELALFPELPALSEHVRRLHGIS